MPKVEIKGNVNVELAIRRFKRLCDRAGIVADVRKKDFYEKPAWKRKREKMLVANKIRQNNRGESGITDFNTLMRGLARTKFVKLMAEKNATATNNKS